MKKFFLIAAAAVVAFASCSKNESPLVQDQNKAISFGTYTGRAVTKADPTFFIPKTQTWLQKQAFGVYAYNTGATAFAGSVASAKKFMVNEEVSFSGASAADATDYKKYSYENEKYWPNDEKNNLLTFWSYYPYDAENPMQFGVANDFTVATDPTEMVDLLLSNVKEDMTYTKATKVDNYGIVPFNFNHALTMVTFYVKTDAVYSAATITLDTLIVKAVADGAVTPEWGIPQGETTAKTTFSWNAGTELVEFPVYTKEANPATGAVLSTDGAYFPVNDSIQAAYLMIPQGIDDVVAEIQYTVTSTDQNVDPVVNKVKVNLKTSNVTEWAINKNIKYTFTVGLRPIKFTAEVEDWDKLQYGDFVIPTVTNTNDPGTNTGDNPTTGAGN